ncbi:MAG: hypothetical protein IT181_03675 [Acidobacteria bacterium]|nr:hypothetical protein [Acidobacteriota bacterium]
MADYPGITNFSRVDGMVACGGATEAAALEGIKNDGFTTVVNLRLASEPGANIEQSQAAATALGLRYVHLPFAPAAPDPSVVDAFLATMADPDVQPVYIHCASANRVGAMWLAKRVLQDAYSIEQATAEARAIGLTNPVLEQFALTYIAARRP